MGLLLAMFLFFSLYMLCKKNYNENENVQVAPIEREETAISPCSLSQEVIKERKENAVLLNRCIHQMNTSKARPTILKWSYIKGSATQVNLLFENTECEIPAVVRFNKNDIINPRVTSLRLANGRTLRGYIVPSFSINQLYEKYIIDATEKDRLLYLNTVANAAVYDGKALFNILEYQKMSQSEFEQTFKKKEQDALVKLLLEKFASVKQSERPWVLEVTPFAEDRT